jgi:hypothetical protein
MWTRIKFVINVTLIVVTCVRMLETWLREGLIRF